MRPAAMRPRSRPRPERVRPRPNDLASRPHGPRGLNIPAFCGYNAIYCVKLNGEDLSCYLSKIESV